MKPFFLHRFTWVWLGGLLLLILASPGLYSAWQWNMKALRLIRGEEKPFEITTLTCSHIWLFVAEAEKGHGPYSQRQVLEYALGCSVNHLPLIKALLPEDQALAQSATELYPEHADTWFWLADLQSLATPEQAIESYWQGLQREPQNSNAWVQLSRMLATFAPDVALRIYEQLDVASLGKTNPILSTEMQFVLAATLSKDDPAQAVDLYRQGLTAKPYDGIRWFELGDLLSKTDPQAALEAYLQSCIYGDPGSHGCYGAGRMAEQLGDPTQAIEYYRRSSWVEALKRADELEALLKSSK